MRDLNDLTDIYAKAAEESLIAAVVIDPALIVEHDLDLLPPEAFHAKRAALWRAILSLYEREDAIDLATVTEWLRTHKQLEEAGDVSYIVGVVSDFQGSGLSAATYADQVIEAWTRRRIASIGLTYAQRINRTDDAVDDVLGDMEKALYDIQRNERGTGLARASEYAEEYADGTARMSTGFDEIDRVTNGGLPIGDLTVLAGRTSMGKSALAHAIAFKVGAVHVVSPDQPLPEIIANEACRRTRIPLDALQARAVHDEAERDRWIKAKNAVAKDMRTTTFDDGSYTLSRLVGDVRRAALQGKRLVIVDHLQSIRPDKRYGSRREFMIDLTGILKDLARDFGISVLALSQLSRAIDDRPNKRPMLADLSESKTIEEDANLVLFLYREKYYDRNTMKGDESEVIVAKNKTGGTGRVARIMFRERFVLFEERSDDGQAR